MCTDVGCVLCTTYRQIVFYRQFTVKRDCIASLARENWERSFNQSLFNDSEIAQRCDRRERELCRNTAFFSLSPFFSSLYRAHSRSLISCTKYDDDDERTQVVATDRVYVARFQYARSLFQAIPAKPEWHLTGNLISVDIRWLRGLFSIDCAQHDNKDQRHRAAWRKIRKLYINAKKRSSLCTIVSYIVSRIFRPTRQSAEVDNKIESAAPCRELRWKEKERKKKGSGVIKSSS